MNNWQENFNQRMGEKTCREIKEIGRQMQADRLITKILRNQNEKVARSKAMKRVKDYLKGVM